MTEESLGEVLSRPGVDRAANLLRDRHRRRILLGLSDGRVEREADVALRKPDQEEVESDLRATHLPMLEKEGIIEWDRESGEIRKGPNFDEIEPFLRLLQEHDDELPPFWP
ncbi:MAG: ArsR family transcriptional regulator [Haloferacaceae archaeon]